MSININQQELVDITVFVNSLMKIQGPDWVEVTADIGVHSVTARIHQGRVANVFIFNTDETAEELYVALPDEYAPIAAHKTAIDECVAEAWRNYEQGDALGAADVAADIIRRLITLYPNSAPLR